MREDQEDNPFEDSEKFLEAVKRRLKAIDDSKLETKDNKKLKDHHVFVRHEPIYLSWEPANVKAQKIEADALANRLQSTVQKLESDISELRSQSGNSLQREDFENLLEELKEAREQAFDISKNVIMPKDLNLRLVRADLLDRLDEYRSQEGHNFLMLGLFGGGAFAIIVNWLTSTDNVKTNSSITLLFILIALIFFFGYKTFETSVRARKVKMKIFEDN